MSLERLPLAQEIRRLIARGVLVVTQAQAMTLADELQAILDKPEEPDESCWLIVPVNAINDEGPIIVTDLTEVDRIYEEILDFHDRLRAGFLPPNSIHMITVNEGCVGKRHWGLPTLALIGDWAPEIQVHVPGVEGVEEVNINERGVDHIASTPPKQEQPVLQFVSAIDPADIASVAATMERNTAELYEQTITGLTQPVTRWLPDEDALQSVERLKDEMPHLSEFLEEVRIAMQLAIRFNATRFTLPPMILNGPPGVGKTFGLFALADALGLSMESVPISTTGAGFVLSGSERGWRDPVPGLLAKVAAKSRHINPIFILDEFEKAPFKRDNGMNGLEPELLQLLERDTAKRFRDVFLEQDLNLAEISYIGSSNTIHQIPEPILSRVKVIEVDYPPPEALQRLYASILNRALIEDLGIEGVYIRIEGCTSAASTAHLSPRWVRNNARRILASALQDKRNSGEVSISATDLLCCSHAPLSQTRQGIGFLAEL